MNLLFTIETITAAEKTSFSEPMIVSRTLIDHTLWLCHLSHGITIWSSVTQSSLTLTQLISLTSSDVCHQLRYTRPSYDTCSTPRGYYTCLICGYNIWNWDLLAQYQARLDGRVNREIENVKSFIKLLPAELKGKYLWAELTSHHFLLRVHQERHKIGNISTRHLLKMVLIIYHDF